MASQQLRTQYLIFYILGIVVFVFFYYYSCCYENIFPFNVYQSLSDLPIPWIKYHKQTSSTTHRNSFIFDWLRMHRSRTDWRAMLNPCSDQMAWGTLKSGWGKMNRSSARKSYISYMDIQSSGQFSRVYIQTRTASGQEKTIGGDFWRVFFSGPVNVSATVFDHQNGTYEAIALLVETGNYSVCAYLDYSLCDGLRDPPENWFRVGNAQGKYQPDGELGFLDHFIYEPLLAAENVTIEVLPKKHQYLPNINCNKSCRSLWDGFGRWRNNVWLPYLSAKHHRWKNMSTTLQRSVARRGTLWIFGDSLAVRFHGSLSSKPLCWDIFNVCRRSYNWLYPVPGENEALGKSVTDDFDFLPEIILDSIREVLRYSDMKNPDSLLVLNLGLHYPISLNFTTFQKLTDDVIVLLRNRERDLGSEAEVIWKTTTSIRKENTKPPGNVTSWRFFTEPRVRLFDAYAMSAMCEAGIGVLDVFPMTASYLRGTTDVVHYDNKVFRSAEKVLETYVKDGSEYQNAHVCIE